MSQELIYAPIFEQDGTKFIFLSQDMTADTAEEASQIGWGTAMVECILLNCGYHGEVFSWNPANDHKSQQGALGGHRVAVVGSWGKVINNALT